MERPPALSGLGGGVIEEPEAYVHWKGYDRRLDSWVRHSLLRKLSEVSEDHGVYPRSSAGDLVPTGVDDVEWEEALSDDAHSNVDREYLKEHYEHTKFKTINAIVMGQYVVSCWYFSPYPLEVQNTPKMHICQFCLSFFKHEVEYTRHRMRCITRHPPGHEIYRDTEYFTAAGGDSTRVVTTNIRVNNNTGVGANTGDRVNTEVGANTGGGVDTSGIAIWEVDGGMSRVYCENLSYVSKLFLDHKTLRHPVHLFLFYVLTEIHIDGYHIVGYFSKEKYSRNNVSCILVLPQYQKKGYGKYLINFSYALALKEGRRGTPERPLSDLGRVSYINYWRQCLLHVLKDRTNFTINEIADDLSFEPSDILTTFSDANMVFTEPFTRQKFLYISDDFIRILSATLGKPSRPVFPTNLRWVPYDPFLGPFEYVAE
ncbi:histone acetyltransferase [Gregarina niphandrodes]|uniref:Histone acetyltransferase n=1 Tax=Gregarina niphandrodes TaxID=110365 RepID=A0A023BBQ3_GRENI|nr:histone acetyltransferase [Gregarina niphandrodes]EZG80254.1 histone acetyltransferase [Gregarina niphandrodes]|eukprot:XP_011134308.1 histone acetyltransferase [Gregarina niphandrodes]